MQPTTVAKTTHAVTKDKLLPDEGSAEEEHASSLALFFILFVLGKLKAHPS